MREMKYSGLSRYLNDAYSGLPSFLDIFDEESFYIAFFALTVATILVCFIASRFITIKEHDM